MFYNDLQVQIVRETVDNNHTNPEYIITEMTLSQVRVNKITLVLIKIDLKYL